MCCTVLKFSLQSAETTGDWESQEGRDLGTLLGGGRSELGPILGRDLHTLPKDYALIQGGNWLWCLGYRWGN